MDWPPLELPVTSSVSPKWRYFKHVMPSKPRDADLQGNTELLQLLGTIKSFEIMVQLEEVELRVDLAGSGAL